MVEAQIGLAGYFDEEAGLSTEELDASEDRWAEANAREAMLLTEPITRLEGERVDKLCTALAAASGC